MEEQFQALEDGNLITTTSKPAEAATGDPEKVLCPSSPQKLLLAIYRNNQGRQSAYFGENAFISPA